MDQTLQNKTKKFLSLLKNSAQNEAFVQLVTDNLRLELQQKPWKMLRVMDFIINELPRSNSDFTRLKINECGLLQSLMSDNLRIGMTSLQQQDFEIKQVQQILDHMNTIPDAQQRQKFIDKLNSSIMILRFDSEIDIENEIMTKLAFFTLSDLMRSNKLFFNQLITNYEPLLSDLSFNQPLDQSSMGKDNIKDMVMKSIGGGFKSANIKLSDLIDESFFDDIVDDSNSQTQYSNAASTTNKKTTSSQLKQQQEVKLSIGELVTQYKNMCTEQIIDLRSLASKRVKQTLGDKNAGLQSQVQPNAHRFIVMSPQLSLILNFTQQLVQENWKMRQAASSAIRTIIQVASKHKIPFYYHVATYFNEELGYQVTQTFDVKIDNLMTMILPYLFFFMLKDQFNDFEELKVLTPAREEGLKLLTQICELSSQNNKNLIADSSSQQLVEINQEISILIQQLPVLLKAVEVDTWPSRYNFFLLLKGLISTEQNRNQLFNMFNRVLIESLLKVEDEVMILVTELIQSMLDLYLKLKDFENYIATLLRNLQENLKQSDEIESSSISVFSLINSILECVPNLEKLDFQIDLNIICPFNFHKVVNLTLQSLTMERSSQLVSLLFDNLKLLVIVFQKPENMEFFQDLVVNSIMTYNSLMLWLFSYHLQSFETFNFFESKNFESIQQDYYKIVYRPTTSEEIKQFYYAKMNNLTQSLAILMQHSPQVCQHIMNVLEQQLLPNENMDQSFQTPVHENHFVYLLTLSRFFELYSQIYSQEISQFVSLEYLNNVTNSLLTITEESIGVYQFGELDKIDNNMQILYGLIQRPSMNQVIDQQQAYMMLTNLSQLLQQCYQQHRLVNLSQIQQQIETLTQLFGQIQVPEIYECFNELMQLFTSLMRYANSTCTRSSVSAPVKIQTQIGDLLQSNQDQVIASADQKQQIIDTQTFKPIPLTTQLNNLIKPILSQVKSEPVDFIQELSARYLISLIELLMLKNKSKAAQQIMQVIVKNLEQKGEEEVQDRGSKFAIKEMLTIQSNIFKAYAGYLGIYLSQNLTLDNHQQWLKAILFIASIIKETKTQTDQFEDISQILMNQIARLFVLQQQQEQQTGAQNSQDQQNLTNNSASSLQLSNLVTLIFELFKLNQIQLISIVVSNMENKSKSAFQVLIELLDMQISDLTNKLKKTDQTVTNEANLKNNQLMQIEGQSMIDTSTTDSGQDSQFVQQLQEQATQGYKFLQIFVNNQMLTEYTFDVKVKAQLRDYQKQGINWMATLGDYNLNCALCDDMGLGKTLQSLCVVVNESHKRFKISGKKPINLIVCPTTITHNWYSEVNKFFDKFKAVVFEGTTSQKAQLIKDMRNYDIVIISYEKLRNEIKSFENIDFFYLIVDEAHIIKNSKAKITQAVKAIKADKKLALTGTPLQNRVSELWSIFDFLMPGFLEEEQIFNKKYNQYLTSNLKRLSEKLEETQSFVEALKSLKKRIQPFILRRTKDQVLKELPPKIIQDVICEMTPFQEYTHSLIEKNHPISQQLQKVCNHPMLVAKEFKEDKNIQKHFNKKKESELLSYENSGKLIGLYDKLVECEIIETKRHELTKEESKTSHSHHAKDTGDSDINASNLFDLATASFSLEAQRQNELNNKHRVLIFCQMTSFLNLIVEQILKRFNVPYLELLSALTPKQRVEMCNQFNQDANIRVLILTTQVGGLGLNLTGADTVIFAEHDWNPMRDLQAIDRAHRIGQTKQVCVYRLIFNPRELLKKEQITWR
eukprot:403357149